MPRVGRPRKPRSPWPPLPRRTRNSGSISRHPITGELRVRLPRELNPSQSSRRFAADDLDGATTWLGSEIRRVRRGDRWTPATTLLDWATFWHESNIEPNRSRDTARVYWYALEQLGADLLGMPLRDIRPMDLQAAVARLAARLDPDGVHRAAGVWRACLESAVDNELLLRNPARGLDLPRTRKKPASKRARVWTPEEQRTLWAGIQQHRFLGAYALILGCGLRLGEVLGLRWADVDLDTGRAWIGRQFTKSDFVEDLKAHNPHPIRLPSPVVAALRLHRSRQPAGMTLVMEHAHGRPWGETLVRRELQQLAVSLGVPPYGPHQGRHALATNLIDQGVPAPVVAEMLGNTAATVHAYYAHAAEPSAERAHQLVTDLFTLPEPEAADAS